MEAAIAAAGSAGASAARTIRELVAHLEARSAEAADARVRLELAERAQSALRGELESEREERRRIWGKRGAPPGNGRGSGDRTAALQMVA